MKKRLFVLLFAGMLALTGCQSKEEAQREKVEAAFESIGMEHSAVIMGVLSKEWKVQDGEGTYIFTKEGTGEASGDAFTYSCGFDEDNNIALKLTMDADGEERYFYVSTDDTGYGLYLQDATSQEKVYLLQNNVELLPLTDERASGFIGEWADKSDNRYIFHEDGTMMIKGSESETPGTFSVVEQKEDGSLLMTLVFGSDTMEFTYEFLSDGKTLQLCRPGTETVHTWIRK